MLTRVCSSVYFWVQAATLHKDTFGDDVALSPALLTNLKANTIKDRRAGMEASACLICDLQQRSDKGEIRFIALYSNIIRSSKNVLKATQQALSDVKKPTDSQYYTGDRKAPLVGKRMLMAVVWSSISLLEKGARFTELSGECRDRQYLQEQ